MSTDWSDPRLGSFEFDGLKWLGQVNLPAFVAYTASDDERRSAGWFELFFDCDDENDVPDARGIALVEKVIANQKRLVELIANALWDDLKGEGPGSGMWWHGDLDGALNNMFTDEVRERPTKATDLHEYLSLSSVDVRKDVETIEGPVVEMGFYALFEEEHGVGVLTDGERVLGFGYRGDATPFGT